jgi:hypothetical protein
LSDELADAIRSAASELYRSAGRVLALRFRSVAVDLGDNIASVKSLQNSYSERLSANMALNGLTKRHKGHVAQLAFVLGATELVSNLDLN